MQQSLPSTVKVLGLAIAVSFATACAINPPIAAAKGNVGTNIHALNNDSWTSLHRAARENALDRAKLLVWNGADIHAKDNNGLTPLEVVNLELAVADGNEKKSLEELQRLLRRAHRPHPRHARGDIDRAGP